MMVLCFSSHLSSFFSCAHGNFPPPFPSSWDDIRTFSDELKESLPFFLHQTRFPFSPLQISPFILSFFQPCEPLLMFPSPAGAVPHSPRTPPLGFFFLRHRLLPAARPSIAHFFPPRNVCFFFGLVSPPFFFFFSPKFSLLPFSIFAFPRPLPFHGRSPFPPLTFVGYLSFGTPPQFHRFGVFFPFFPAL